jgi:hypothetical protein
MERRRCAAAAEQYPAIGRELDVDCREGCARGDCVAIEDTSRVRGWVLIGQRVVHPEVRAAGLRAINLVKVG